MSRLRDSARRTTVACRLFLRDLVRRRITLLLLLVVPALFDLVVVVTTKSRDVEVTLAALVEEGATLRVPGQADLFDPGLLDNGARTLDARAVSLVFMAMAAVCFLTCFLAFHLAHRHNAVDARLVLSGYRPAELLAAKLGVLLALVVLLSVYETALLRALLAPQQFSCLVAGLVLGGVVYGGVGLLVGAVVRMELEGIFLIVLLTNVDVGWLQNPEYYAASERRALIESLPGHLPAQLALVGAFTAEHPRATMVQALAYAGAVLGAALIAFVLRLRSRIRA